MRFGDGEPSVTETQTINIEPTHPAVGARVSGVDLRRPIEPSVADELRAAFARYAVLCLSDQELEAGHQIDFAAVFGPVDDDDRQMDDPNLQQSRRGVMYVSNIREDGKLIGVLPDGEMHFHSDGMHRDRPYRATTLYAIKVPSHGGDTMFSSQAAAYEALPADLQRRLDGLQGRQVFNYNKTTRAEIRSDPDETAFAIHPLVRTHPDTGRKSLFLSRLMTHNIVGMEDAAGEALLLDLIDHCEKPDFVYCHKWSPGDLVIWDNRCVNHARTDFSADEPRLLRRYTVSEPVQCATVDDHREAGGDTLLQTVPPEPRRRPVR